MQSMFGRASRTAMAVLIAVSMVTAPFGYSQHSVQNGQRRLLFDHEAHVENLVEESLDNFSMEEFGERINPDTGELSFRHVDIDLPGSSDFQISFIRYISSDPDRPSFFGNASSTSSRGLGNWSVDLPYIVLPSIKSNGTPGCITDSTEVDVKDEMFVAPRIRLKVKTFSLLKTAGISNKEVFGSDLPSYTTSSIMKIEQTKSNGKCKWEVTTDSGTKYEFTQVRVMEEKNGKKKHAVLPKKITDVNGNFANFTYEGSQHRLKRIKASDGREIEMVYNRAGTLLSCAIAKPDSKTTKKRIIYYKYKTMAGLRTQYLYRAGVLDTNFYWEFDELAGVNRQYGNEYARRCSFGKNARIRNPFGLIAEYKTKKIINFVEAESPDGHKSTSHRAACLPPIDFFDKDWDYLFEFQGSYELEYDQALKSSSLSDGTSSFGNFSTFFTSAVTERKITEIDQSVSIWKFDYAESDQFNPNFDTGTHKTVHKNANSPVYVNVKKPKTRTVTDPLGTKTVYKIGRSLKDTGLLISVDVYAKGSKTAIHSSESEYTHSKKPLGKAWNRERTNQTVAERWTRRSEETVKINGVTYTTEYVYDDYGFPTKTTKSSTIQTKKNVENITYTHLKPKWILGLVKTRSLNGRELMGASHDKNGRKILETRFGSQFMRFSWSGGNLYSSRNGADETTSNFLYRRGIPQQTRLENGAVFKKVVDDNGRVTQTTSPTGNVEKITYNTLGWQTKIDRMTGYADTTIEYEAPSTESIYGYVILRTGLVKTETTGSGTSKKIVKTTHNGYGQPILIETRDSTAKVSIYTRIQYDKLGREIFRSFPSFISTATAGVETKYDAIDRIIQKRENVSPYATETYTYLSNNGKRTTDAENNSTTVYRSGYGSPDDGKETKRIEANGRVTYREYDKWQNLTEVRQVAAGKTKTSTFRYNSFNQLCFESNPNTGTRAIEYDDAWRVNRVEYEVAESYVCKKPVKVQITSLSPYKVCTTQQTRIQIRGVPEPEYDVRDVTTCKYVLPKTKIQKEKEKKSPKTPSQEPTQSGKMPVICLSTHYWNGTKCTPVNPYPFYSDTVEKGVLLKHNSLGQVISINYPSASTPSITKEYDLEGRVVKIVKGGVTLAYTYGKRGELLTETLTVTHTDDNKKKITRTFKATYTYNETGGRISYFTPRGNMVKYVLNAFNQITNSTINGLTIISDVKYHENGEKKSALLHNTNKSKNSETVKLESTINGRKIQNKYQLLKGLNFSDAIFSFTTSYDKKQRVKSIVSNSLGNRTYSYDSDDQVLSVSGDGKSITYTYDLFKNLLSRREKESIQTNVYHKTTGKLIKSVYKRITNNVIPQKGTEYPINFDDVGRIERLGESTLTYDDSDRLTTVEIKSGNILKKSQKNSYDGNHNRALSLTKYVHDSSNVSNVSKNRRTYEFVSLQGNLIHRSITEKNFNEKQQGVRKPGSYDYVRIDSNLSLEFGECINWIITNYKNNHRTYLNSDNSVFRRISLDPYGRSIKGEENTEKGCEPPPKYVKPTPLLTNLSPYWSIWFIFQSETQSTSNNESNKVIESKNRYNVFVNGYPDEHTNIYYLDSKPYYSSFIGRHIVPKKSEINYKNATFIENRYALKNSDHVSGSFTSSPVMQIPESIQEIKNQNSVDTKEYLVRVIREKE